MEEMVSRGAQLARAYRGKRVLITGHTGFKGSWLALWLTSMGAEVFGFSDGIPTEPNHHQLLDLPVDETIGDIADAQAIADAVRRARPEIVFHLAAQSLVKRAFADPLGTYRTNVLGTLALLEACRACDTVRAIVSATTDKVYKNREWDWGYRETDELGGSDPYSASKSCVELLTNSYRSSFLADRKMLVASVRAGNVVGGGDWAQDRLIPDAMRAHASGQPLRVRNPASTRPWQHVLDPLAGYLLVGTHLMAGDRFAEDAWNFGPLGRATVTVGQILGALEKRLPGLHVDHVPDNSGQREANLLELDSSKASTRLGWKPVWEDQIIERTVEWYSALYDRGLLLSRDQLAAYVQELDLEA